MSTKIFVGYCAICWSRPETSVIAPHRRRLRGVDVLLVFILSSPVGGGREGGYSCRAWPGVKEQKEANGHGSNRDTLSLLFAFYACMHIARLSCRCLVLLLGGRYAIACAAVHPGFTRNYTGARVAAAAYGFNDRQRHYYDSYTRSNDFCLSLFGGASPAGRSLCFKRTGPRAIDAPLDVRELTTSSRAKSE